MDYIAFGEKKRKVLFTFVKSENVGLKATANHTKHLLALRWRAFIHRCSGYVGNCVVDISREVIGETEAVLFPPWEQCNAPGVKGQSHRRHIGTIGGSCNPLFAWNLRGARGQGDCGLQYRCCKSESQAFNTGHTTTLRHLFTQQSVNNDVLQSRILSFTRTHIWCLNFISISSVHRRLVEHSCCWKSKVRPRRFISPSEGWTSLLGRWATGIGFSGWVPPKYMTKSNRRTILHLKHCYPNDRRSFSGEIKNF